MTYPPPWRETYVYFQRRDYMTGERLRGPVMTRLFKRNSEGFKHPAIRIYRAMTAAELANWHGREAW